MQQKRQNMQKKPKLIKLKPTKSLNITKYYKFKFWGNTFYSYIDANYFIYLYLDKFNLYSTYLSI